VFTADLRRCPCQVRRIHMINRGADFVGLSYLPVVAVIPASLLDLPGLSGLIVLTHRQSHDSRQHVYIAYKQFYADVVYHSFKCFLPIHRPHHDQLIPNITQHHVWTQSQSTHFWRRHRRFMSRLLALKNQTQRLHHHHRKVALTKTHWSMC